MCPVSRLTRPGAAALALLLAGCAHVHVDEQGRRHVIGFVALTLPAPEGHTGADTLRTRSLGLTITRSPVGDALTLGWSDTSLTAVRDHSLVNLPAGEDR
jgi:hypothetical protein